MEMGVVPVVNENDTVVTDEICFGDNDTLGALVANLVEADVLVLLTDQDGLYTADPRSNPDAKLVSQAWASDASLSAMAGGGGVLGRGGMATKVRAARLAARSGASTLIAGGRVDNVLTRLHGGETLGTWLQADAEPVAARKQWIAGHLQTRGELVLDDGAVKALREGNRSLLPIGIISASGHFQRGEVVACVDEQGILVAKGLANFSIGEARQVLRLPSSRLEHALGRAVEPEMIHRDNLVIV